MPEREQKRLKILLVTGIFPPDVGGASVVYQQLAANLGAEMNVLAPTRDGVSRRADAAYAFGINRAPFFQHRGRVGECGPVRAGVEAFKRMVVARVSIGSALIRQLRRARPEVVCLGQPYLYWAVGLIRRFTPAPIVFYVHGEEIALADGAEMRRAAGRVTSFVYSRMLQALRRADAVVTGSRFSAEQLVRLGVPERTIRIIHYGVDHGRYSPGEQDTSVVARHGIQGKRVVLTIARLDARKGHDCMIRAMPAILKAVPNLVYVIVGDGPERGRLDTLVEQLSLQAHVIFAGRVRGEELCAYYRSCDLFIQPNRTMPDGDTEGFGLVFLEAGACGKPVIGGNAGGVPEAIVHDSTGLLVDGSSETKVAEAAIRVLCEPDIANTFGANGRAWAARFSWAETARKFRELCAELTRASSSRSIERHQFGNAGP